MQVKRLNGNGLGLTEHELTSADGYALGSMELEKERLALLSSRDEDGRILLRAPAAYAMDVADPEREWTFYRPQCAELLIDAGALVEPSVWEGVIGTGASGMLQ